VSALPLRRTAGTWSTPTASPRCLPTALFEPQRVNKGFAGTYFVLREAGIDTRLVDLVHRLTYSPHGDDLTEVALTLADSRPLDNGRCGRQPAGVSVVPGPGPLRWHSADDLRISQSGRRGGASKVVPAMNDWIGKRNREIQCYPLLRFREGVQSLGLLRKHKGTLLLTKAGVAAQRDADRLWEHLAGRLDSKSDEKFEAQAILLMLAFAAASAGSKLPFDKMTALLAELGWRYSDGRLSRSRPCTNSPSTKS